MVFGINALDGQVRWSCIRGPFLGECSPRLGMIACLSACARDRCIVGPHLAEVGSEGGSSTEQSTRSTVLDLFVLLQLEQVADLHRHSWLKSCSSQGVARRSVRGKI